MNKNLPAMQFETACIHAGQEPDPTSGAVMTPIYQTSTYHQQEVGKHKGYEYSRTGNPTRAALEANLAVLEQGQFGYAFASGMAAIDTILRLLSPGDHVVAGNDVYGGTYRLFEQVLHPFGIDFTYIDSSNLEQVKTNLLPNTRLVWLETPSNPLLRISDIAAIAKIAHKQPQSILVVVDNTFATPYLQQPLVLGADLVVHSTTKYLAGHSDVIGGVIVGKDEKIGQRVHFMQNAVGAIPGPMDCFLTLRGIKTLAVRMDRHSENAKRVSDFLAFHPKVKQLYYPFHASHPGTELARHQMHSGGGVISFTLKGGAAEAIRVAQSTRLFSLAESLGGVESLIEVPAAMTHASTVSSPLAITPDLIRLSVGIEKVEDLLADLAQALE
jgi:cystathionine beta-lyase/cystathionine gamma-synthase